MAKMEILIVIAFASMVCCSELEDGEQKKRGVGKATAINSIPSSAQKQEYSYSVYQNSQNPSSQSYQNQVSSSFYPNQGSSQYYSNPSTEAPSTSQHVSPTRTSQFVPINFVPSPGYQSRYQPVPSKSPNVQLAIVQQPNSYPSQSILPYHQIAQSLFSPQTANHGNPQHGHAVHQIPQFNIPANYQNLPLANPFLNHPSGMVLLSQPNPSIYNNLLYPNPAQGLYNYYPTNSQTKYNSYPTASQTEYEKYQGPLPQIVPKEENEVGTQSADYSSSSDSNSGYKSQYSSRIPYGKAQ